MKKVAKILLSIIGVLALFIGVLSLLAREDSQINISSKKVIESPVDVVYDQIRYLSKFPTWSPYLVTDPNQKYRVTGADGKVGATFHWEGVDEEGIGSQTIVKIEENKLVKMRCDIITPFEANPEFTYTIKEVASGVEVTQDFSVAMPFPSNVFSYAFGLRDEMRKTNELGLERLKSTLEKHGISHR